MTTTFDSFDSSQMGAFIESPLGARNGTVGDFLVLYFMFLGQTVDLSNTPIDGSLPFDSTISTVVRSVRDFLNAPPGSGGVPLLLIHETTEPWNISPESTNPDADTIPNAYALAGAGLQDLMEDSTNLIRAIDNYRSFDWSGKPKPIIKLVIVQSLGGTRIRLPAERQFIGHGPLNDIGIVGPRVRDNLYRVEAKLIDHESTGGIVGIQGTQPKFDFSVVKYGQYQVSLDPIPVESVSALSSPAHRNTDFDEFGSIEWQPSGLNINTGFPISSTRSVTADRADALIGSQVQSIFAETGFSKISKLVYSVPDDLSFNGFNRWATASRNPVLPLIQMSSTFPQLRQTNLQSNRFRWIGEYARFINEFLV